MMPARVTAADDAQRGHPGLRGLGTSRTGVIWPLVIGMRKAQELYYTGESVTGSEAERIGMINYAFPKDELESRTLALADRIANLSADHLAILKVNMNRFYENMGIYSSVRTSTDLDAAAQFTAQSYAWQDKMRESVEAGTGLKAALDWRDGPYRDYRAKGEPAAPEEGSLDPVKLVRMACGRPFSQAYVGCAKSGRTRERIVCHARKRTVHRLGRTGP